MTRPTKLDEADVRAQLSTLPDWKIENGFFVPLLLVLLAAGLLLVATGGLSYVAPFFYAIF